jgi:hypothetical protein
VVLLSNRRNDETIVLLKAIAKFAEIVKIVDYRLELLMRGLQLSGMEGKS